VNTYSLSAAAIQDLNELCDYIAQNQPQAAHRIFDNIRQRCKLLAQFPNMGKSYNRLSQDLKGALIEDYIIFYYPKQDGIDVVQIVGGCRDLEALFDESF